MPEHFKALVVVLFFAISALSLAKGPICAAAYDESTFRRHRALWLSVTLFAFLSHSFWLGSLLCAFTLGISAQKERVPLALYCLVLFAFPHFSLLLPGIGPIENFFEVNHIRTLNLVVLLPLAVVLYRNKNSPAAVSRGTDVALLGLLLVMFIKHALDDSVIGTARQAFYLAIDIWVPYYVASRALTTIQQFRQVAAALLLATMIVALLAVFESARFWLLFESLRQPLGLPIGLPMYLLRVEGGALRANVSLGNAIVLGYVIMVGFGMYGFLAPRLTPRWKQLAAAACLIAGLGASFSRGPWVGTAAMMLVMIALGPGLGKRLAKAIGAGGVTVVALMLSPHGQRVIDLLPFIGTVDPGSADYRSRLFEVSMQVFWQNPVFGDTGYLQNPIMEQMRQGQGIIDMVNTYLQIALPYGGIGLLLFLGALLLPLLATWRARRRLLHTHPEAERLGRVLLATMVGILVTIATVSSIGVIPTIYWLMAGLCVSYARVVNRLLQPSTTHLRAHGECTQPRKQRFSG
ncbi:MAG: O-antigen ligase family protein [Gammaproteobacteria bacterium]|nr:O-antigen ligase family protein [Gammaproteobacteria bacterium]